MGLINDGEEDRLSNMPEDIIHHILSFLDTKFAVQFCTLSHKWKNTWTSTRHLNFDNDSFSSIPKFENFIEDTLSHRNDQTEVCAVKLRFTREKITGAVMDTVDYAYLHNVQELTIQCESVNQLPFCLFSSPTLKHLSLSNSSSTGIKSRIMNSAWNLPALETLYLGGIRLGDLDDTNLNLFHECVKLTSLTLEKCSMYDLEIFYVCALNLLNLTITRTSIFPEVFHVFAPHLETLTAGGYSSSYKFLKLSTEEEFTSLEKVNFSLSSNVQKREKHVPSLLNLLKKVSSAKSLILDVNITEMLASSMDELSHKPCPFNNLKCLKINTAMWKGTDNLPTITPQVRNYLLQNSPNATFINSVHKQSHAHAAELHEAPRPSWAYLNMAPLKQRDRIPTFPIQGGNCLLEKSSNATFVMDSPLQVPQKRPRQQLPDDTMANKVPKLYAEKEQPETIANENRILKEKLQRQKQLIANYKEAFRSKIHMQDQKIAKEKTMLMGKIQMKEKLIATLEAQNSQYEKLIPHIIISKIFELSAG